MEEFSEINEDWWVKGVPQKIRQECASRRESDKKDRKEPYAYTYLLDLKEILSKNWPLFQEDYNKLKAKFPRKDDFLKQLEQLNDIRNRHAHAVRAPKSGTSDYDNDLKDTQEILIYVLVFCGEVSPTVIVDTEKNSGQSYPLRQVSTK